MTTTIKQILEWPQNYQSGGFVMHIITAKKKKQIGEGAWIQGATISDGNDEMYARFVLKGNVPLPSNSPVKIIVCERTFFDIKDRQVQGIRVFEWELPKMTADEWEKEQLDIKEEWDKQQDKRIRGMVRHGIVCAMIKRGEIPCYSERDYMDEEGHERRKKFINYWVEYIITGN